MRVQVLSKLNDKYEAIAIPVFDGEKINYEDKAIQLFIRENPGFGKLYETHLIYSQNQKILLVGVGKRDKFNYAVMQNYAGTAVRSVMQIFKEIVISLPEIDVLSPEELVEAGVIGADIAEHDLSLQYKSETKLPKLTSIFLLTADKKRGYQNGLKSGKILSDAINLTRRLGDMPPNEMTPTYFLNVAKKVAKENRLKITIIDEKQAKRKGMGAFAGVAQGSDEPSYIIAIEYQGDGKSKEKWGLIGKGVTFDTGGVSVKPSSGLHEMKYDMLGAATVLAAMQTIAKLKLKKNVVAVMGVTENHLGGKSQRPGDIVKTYSGKTAEILNTDAEGRLVLADALTYAQKDLKATKFIDIATLTGAMIVALGDHITGVFANNSDFASQLVDAGKKVGEKYWELPMDEEYDEMVLSSIADITNIGHGGSMPSAAGSITGAKFIEAVVKDNAPWMHLDIAGTAWDMNPKPFRGVGATGVGVKTLVKLISKKEK